MDAPSEEEMHEIYNYDESLNPSAFKKELWKGEFMELITR
jgi:hypothetical protein